MKAIVYGMMALLAALPVAAQVGHEPARSPYRDLEFSQEITPLFGWVKARHDPVGTAPRSAPMFGLRYEWSFAGPLALSSDLSHTLARRTPVDPTQVAAKRVQPDESSSVNAVDVALAVNLTGRKSWRSIVPQVRVGLGLVSGSAKDSLGFTFGTPFAFTLGGGLKVVPGGRVQLRADVTDRIFKLSYPETYYRPASDNTAVLDNSTPRSFYTHHTALTVGVSYLFGR